MDVTSKANVGPSSGNSRREIETLTRLAQVAYDGDRMHSLLANVRNLKDDDWMLVPPGGGRCAGEIVEHAGWCKWMYEDYAFGSAALRGDQPPLVPADGARARPHAELLGWAEEGHRRWVASILALPDDSELDRLRTAHWGDQAPTRTLIQILIAHDLYHAGEINHLRALIQGTDRWPNR